MGDAPAQRVTIVGLQGGRCFGTAAEAALRRASLLVGAPRHLRALPASLAGRRVETPQTLSSVLDLAAERTAAGEEVCLLASGDPGFFGLVRLAADRLGPERLSVHPAPSSPSLAFARLGDRWDDAVVVSAHGRALSGAVCAVLHNPKVAVLVAPDQPPEVLGKALVAAGCGPRRVHVCSRLASPDETVTEADLVSLAGGKWDPLSVVVLRAPTPADGTGAGGPGLAWGLPESRFEHRDAMITKAEVRAVALGKLSLPAAGVLWDLGAGSGSVAAECARIAPGLSIFAVERDGSYIARLRTNLASTAAVVVEGSAPEALAGLPDPDRVFVGGGGIEVLDAAMSRLRPDGTVVATYATLERAASAAGRLGNLVQIAVARGRRVGTAGTAQFRLEAQNPVFVAWGPGPDSAEP